MKRDWTQQQIAAINSTNGSILVSAAAGSGKTAVLVERVIKRITDNDSPCPANSLLVVTFTKAAAGEMKERIYAALKEKIRKDPENSYLRQQEMLLPNADICTMDSFFNSLVKENFRLLDISPDYKKIDDNELLLLESEAIDTVMENEYKKGDKAFLDLVELLFKNRDDGELAECIKKLYNYSGAYAFPNEWLDSVAEGYDSSVDVSENVWGKAILDHAIKAAEYCIDINNSMLRLMSDDENMTEAFYDAVMSDRNQIETLLEFLKNGEWDNARAALGQKFVTRGRVSAEDKETELFKLLETQRATIKEICSKKIGEYLCVSNEENKKDCEFLYPIIKKLIECIKLYGEELMRLKKEKNSYDFSDISHMALSLLVEKSGDNLKKTPLAHELSNRYTEILIDEYQDTNEAQHILFSAVSKNEQNVFRVGDIKQSIYSFRLAMPQIFTSLRDGLDEYRGNNYPAKITLDKNFRSRKGVTDFVNFVFSQTMSDELGGVEYGETEKLVAGGNYENTDEVAAQLDIIDMTGPGNFGKEPHVCQARHIASVIKQMISEGTLVGKKGEERPIQYRDISILLRSTKGDFSTALTDELRNWGIPCFMEVKGSFFNSAEIAIILSLLRVIDNPNRDIPLLSALMSPIFSFTPDETAKIRMIDRKASIYACLLKCEKENEKVARFLKFFRQMRFVASACTASELIRRILDETSFFALVQAMSSGEKRRSNLLLLMDYAEVYEKSGMIGLSGFIKFIDKLFTNKKELDASNPISENADVVRIMTIHKSKGLEFPVCILANMNKQFNEEDEKKDMIINPDCGVGILRKDPITMAKYKTVSHKSSKLQMNLMSKSEEMRVLYVAMTRAEEKLIMVMTKKDADKELQKAASDIDPINSRLSPFSLMSKKTYSDWLLKAAIRHPDANEIRQNIGLSEEYRLQTPSRLNMRIIFAVKEYSEVVTDLSKNNEIDEKLQNLISDRVNFKYKYAPLASVATKRAASQLDGKLIDRENFATSKPNFMLDGKLTATQKGTATHKFMQYADFALSEKDVFSEANRLVLENKLTEDEAKNIRMNEVKSFFESELYKRIKNSQNVMREKKFTINVPAEWVYPELKDELNENIMIQGMIDCAFEENGEFTVVDYKTDRFTSDEDFRREYSSQLRIYRHALEQITNKKVKETLVYSFKLSKTIEIL